MDDFEERTIIRQGMMSFYENNGKLINPFRADTKEHNWFERGWTQALKRHKGSVDNPSGAFSSNSPSGGSMAEKYRNMKDWNRKDDD